MVTKSTQYRPHTFATIYGVTTQIKSISNCLTELQGHQMDEVMAFLLRRIIYRINWSFDTIAMGFLIV